MGRMAGREESDRAGGVRAVGARIVHDRTHMSMTSLDAFSAHLVGRVVASARSILPDALIGVYLHGSAVLGGLRHRSDLDLLAASHRRITADERRRLVEELLALSGGLNPVPPHRAVELTVVAISDVRPWRFPPRMDFQFGEWLRPQLENGGPAPSAEANPDLAPLITMVRLGNAPVFGPPPAELFEPVPHADFMRAIIGSVGELCAALESDTRNVVLTLARIWSAASTGAILSKDDAAAWALGRLPREHACVLERARAIYIGAHEEGWSDLAPHLQPYAQYVCAKIGRLRAVQGDDLRQPAARHVEEPAV